MHSSVLVSVLCVVMKIRKEKGIVQRTYDGHTRTLLARFTLSCIRATQDYF